MKSLKAYVVTTGMVFALVVLAHVLRVVEEGSHLVKEPSFILLTAAAAGLAVWAWALTRSKAASRGDQHPNDG
jgi:hypothetical protein